MSLRSKLKTAKKMPTIFGANGEGPVCTCEYLSPKEMGPTNFQNDRMYNSWTTVPSAVEDKEWTPA